MGFKPKQKNHPKGDNSQALCLQLSKSLWDDLYCYLLHVRKVYPKLTRQELIRQMINHCLDEAAADD